MTKNERLKDLEQQRAGLISDRDQMIRTTNSRTRRTKLVKQLTRRVRDLRQCLAQAEAEIRRIRSASEYPGGSIYDEIDQRDAGIARLNKQLVTVRHEARIEKLLELAAKINSMKEELAIGDEDVSEEVIIS